MSDTPRSVGYVPLPNYISEEPATQSGIRPNLPSDVGPQSARIAADPVLMADAPDPRDTTPIAPGPDGGGVGSGSLGTPVEGWHPGADD